MDKWVWFALCGSVAVAALLSPLASSWPDGLERVAEDLGISGTSQGLPLSAPMPDYAFPGIESEPLATALAGLVGTLVVFALAIVLGRALRTGRDRNSAR